MKKALLTLISLGFIAGLGMSTITLAAKHTEAERIAAACKDKKAGEMVKVDGKEVKCPEAKK